MTAYEPRVAGGDAGLPAARNQTPAPAGTSTAASRRPERARTWRIEFPPGMELITSNHRSNHWGPRHKLTAAIKGAAILLARQAKIPELGRVSFVAEFRPPPGRRRIVREAHNLAPAVKAAIDGVMTAGVIRDDSDKYVAEVTFRAGDPHPQGQLVLIITELSEGLPMTKTTTEPLNLADVEARIGRHSNRDKLPTTGDPDFLDLSLLIDRDAPALLDAVKQLRTALDRLVDAAEDVLAEAEQRETDAIFSGAVPDTYCRTAAEKALRDAILAIPAGLLEPGEKS